MADNTVSTPVIPQTKASHEQIELTHRSSQEVAPGGMEVTSPGAPPIRKARCHVDDSIEPAIDALVDGPSDYEYDSHSADVSDWPETGHDKKNLRFMSATSAMSLIWVNLFHILFLWISSMMLMMSAMFSIRMTLEGGV